MTVSPNAVKFWLRTRTFTRLLGERGFRQIDVAAACEVSKSTVTRWKGRTLSVRGDYALTVCALLNAGFAELFEKERAEAQRLVAPGGPPGSREGREASS